MRFLPRAVVLLIASLAVGLLPMQAAEAQSEWADDSSPHSEAELVSEVASIAPGEPFTVALRLEMEEGWHSYWKNPGDSGEPTSIDWSLPSGFEVGAIQWPYPHRIDTSMLTSYGYSDEVLLLTTLTPPEDLEPGTSLTLDARAEWLICADICLPAHGDVQLTLPVTASSPDPGAGAEAIAQSRAKLPKTVDAWTVQAARSSGSYTLALTSTDDRRLDLEGAQFYPLEEQVLDHAAPQPVSQEGSTSLIALQQSSYASSPADSLEGVLVAPEGQSWDADRTVRAMKVNVPVDTVLTGVAATVSAAASAGGGSSLSLEIGRAHV